MLLCNFHEGWHCHQLWTPCILPRLAADMCSSALKIMSFSSAPVGNLVQSDRFAFTFSTCLSIWLQPAREYSSQPTVFAIRHC
jgi:hypothetical protein